MRALTLALILAVPVVALAPVPAAAQDATVKPSPIQLPGGLSFGHGRFAGAPRPGLSTTISAGKNTSLVLGAGAMPALNQAPPSVSGSVGLTIRF